MSRILLADDSPHAQRMGVRILREEGFEVVSVTDGATAVVRLADVRPDVVIADVFLPGKSGVDLCRYIKDDPRFARARIILVAGLLERFDEEAARAAGCDAILKKPFEASVLVKTVHQLIEEAELARTESPVGETPEPVAALPEPALSEPPPIALPPPEPAPLLLIEPPPLEPAAVSPETPPAEPPTGEPEPVQPIPQPLTAAPTPAAEPEADPERVRAAVTIALDAALPALINEITDRVLVALRR